MMPELYLRKPCSSPSPFVPRRRSSTSVAIGCRSGTGGSAGSQANTPTGFESSSRPRMSTCKWLASLEDEAEERYQARTPPPARKRRPGRSAHCARTPRRASPQPAQLERGLKKQEAEQRKREDEAREERKREEAERAIQLRGGFNF